MISKPTTPASAAIRAANYQWELAAYPMAKEPAIAWDVWLTDVGPMRFYNVGGIWRERWKYYSAVRRMFCRHDITHATMHNLPVADTMYAALLTISQDIGKFTHNAAFVMPEVQQSK